MVGKYSEELHDPPLMILVLKAFTQCTTAANVNTLYIFKRYTDIDSIAAGIWAIHNKF
jgi:hypothetical protein